MIKSNEFKDFYNKELLSELGSIESERKGIIAKLIFIFIFVGALFPVLGYLLVKATGGDLFNILFLIPVAAIVGVGLFAIIEPIVKSATFYKHFKWKIINKIIHYINPNLHYDKKLYVSRHEYYESKFFDDKDKVHYLGDDHVSGTIKGVKIEFSELHTKFLKKKSKEECQFRGVYFVARFPKNFAADILIKPKSSGLTSKIKTLSSSFDDNFTVQLLKGNESDINSILNKEILDNISEFYSQIHNDIFISFIENKMFVAISHDKDLFEPHLWNSNTNFDFILMHYKDLFYPISIIEHFAI